MWTAVLAAAAGCFALKLAGWSVPQRWVEGRRVRQTAVLLPVALLAGLVVVQAFVQGGAEGRSLTLDARAAGLAVGAALLALRAPFLVVVLAAALTAAVLRAL
jgi:hypothetical protein